jgi:hypothetical protein
MTMTRPCLRMILHLLQIFFTLGLTFMPGLFLRRRRSQADRALIVYLYR